LTVHFTGNVNVIAVVPRNGFGAFCAIENSSPVVDSSVASPALRLAGETGTEFPPFTWWMTIDPPPSAVVAADVSGVAELIVVDHRVRGVMG
jgi:hypothetical protein